MSDYELFWSAFGAIGTTVGSLITAIAVVIALVQYRQPLIKKMRIDWSFAFPVTTDAIDTDISLIHIRISNVGARDINISNVHIQIEKFRLYINNVQYIEMPTVSFPIILKPEECIDMYLLRKNISSGLMDAINYEKYSRYSKVYILVTDNSGDKYWKYTKLRVKKLVDEN